jgi:hypothetical protein
MARSNRRTLGRILIPVVVIAVLLMSTVSLAASNEDGITPEMIAAAEALLGLELSITDRVEIIDGLTEYREDYAQLRAFPFDDSIVPSVVFNPIPPGMTFSSERLPFRYSDVDIERPADLEDVAFYTVPQLAKLIRTRQVTSLELTRMYLDRLKRYNPTYLFAVTITEGLALEQAAQADARSRGSELYI